MKLISLVRSLRIKLLLPVLLVAVAMSCATTVALFQRTEAYLHEVAESRAEIIGGGLKEVLRSEADTARLSEALTRMADHWLVYALAVSDAQGRVLAASLPGWEGEPLVAEHELDALVYAYTFEQGDGRRIAIYLDGRPGWLKVTNSTRLVALMLAVSIALVVLSIVVTSEWVLFLPMRRIRAFIKARHQGNSQAAPFLHSDDELGEVSRTLVSLFEIEDAERRSIEKHNSSLRDFNGIISHDLKQPLRQMSHTVQLVLERERELLSPQTKQALNRVVQIAGNANDLLDSLLRFSSLELTQHSPERCDLREELCNVLRVQQAQAGERSLQVRIPDEIPMAYCHREMLGRVFDNLIGNAIKYNDAAAVQIDVSVEELKESGELLFRLRDNGIGVPAQHRDRIFTAFRRLHGKNDYGGGTGAGLTLASRILAREGGRIWVEGNEGPGCCFCFVVPAAK